MSELSQVVDALEFKLKKLVDKLQTLQGTNNELMTRLEEMEEKLKNSSKMMAFWSIFRVCFTQLLCRQN